MAEEVNNEPQEKSEMLFSLSEPMQKMSHKWNVLNSRRVRSVITTNFSKQADRVSPKTGLNPGIKPDKMDL